jgi:hypothetical protein
MENALWPAETPTCDDRTMLGLARQLFGLARRFSAVVNYSEIFDSDLNLNPVFRD